MARRTFLTAFHITANKELSEAFAKEVEMEQEERDQIALLSETVCEQYAVMGQHAPICLLGAHLVGYGSKVAICVSRLESLARQQIKRPAPAPSPPSAPAGN